MKNVIYGLRDPRNDVYYYIGKSTIGENRPLSHLVNSHSDNIKKWIDVLKGFGLYPLVDIIEEVDELNNLNIREKYWIKYYKNINPDLLNIQSIYNNIGTRNIKSDNDFDLLCYVFENISNILKNERIYRNINQEDLSTLTGLSRSTISSIERNENFTISSINLYIEKLLTKERTKYINKKRNYKK